MSDKEFVERSEPAAGVCQLTLARPPANALSPELLAELNGKLDGAVKEGARAIVVAGQPGMFSAGLDVPYLLKLDKDEMGRFWATFFGLLAKFARSPVPVGAAITGHCPAGGMVLSLYTDFRIAASGDFKLGLNEVQVGLPMPAIIYGAFRRLVGPRAAEQLGVSGELISPERALAFGLVDELASADAVVERAVERAGRLAAMPPRALADTRKLARADLVALFDDLQDDSPDAINKVWFSQETQGAMRALVARLAEKGQ